MKSKFQKMAGESQNKQVSTGHLNNRTPLNTIQKYVQTRLVRQFSKTNVVEISRRHLQTQKSRIRFTSICDPQLRQNTSQFAG